MMTCNPAALIERMLQLTWIMVIISSAASVLQLACTMLTFLTFARVPQGLAALSAA